MSSSKTHIREDTLWALALTDALILCESKINITDTALETQKEFKMTQYPSRLNCCDIHSFIYERWRIESSNQRLEFSTASRKIDGGFLPFCDS